MVTPAVVIAAPSSGSGKTTVATGLIGALRHAGHVVAPFKVGPDFIDPGYHSLAAGRPGRNLDPVLVSERLIGPLYRHGCTGADIAVVEGVMGLFDGRVDSEDPGPDPAGRAGPDDPGGLRLDPGGARLDPGGARLVPGGARLVPGGPRLVPGGPRLVPGGARLVSGSTAHVAALLGAPVILVVDATGQGHSIAALLHGFSTFAPVRIAGVVLNRVGSPRHEQVLRQAAALVGTPVLGAIPRADEITLPSRHLGLVTAVERGRLAHRAVAAMTGLISRHVDLPAVVAAAASAVTDPPWQPPPAEPAGAPVTVAMAAGRAFSFGYAEHTELLAAAGADVVSFDPLTDELPAGAAGVVLPGGFPEQFTAELSGNDRLRRQIRALATAGGPVQAECGGLTYLVSELDGHPMCDALSGSARFTPRLTLRYHDAVAVTDSSMYQAGDRVVGHEFHRTQVTFADSYPPAWRYLGRDVPCVRDGAVDRGVHASYLHVHPAAVPHAVGRFVAHAAKACR